MNRRVLLALILILIVALGITAYFVSIGYDMLTVPGDPVPPATPTGSFEDVTFPSRGQSYKVHAFYMPGQDSQPALISVHGWKATRHDQYHLDRAQSLRDLGYTVLSIDLQDNGGDTVEDGHLSLGYKERYDVLGAFDYLLTRNFAADRIGLVGESEGGSTSLMAAGLEPRIKAIWEDSGYTRADSVVAEQAANFGYPPIVVLPGMILGFLKTGDRLWEVTPITLGTTLAANKQAVYIVHDVADKFVLYHHGVDLYNAYHAAGMDVTMWSVPDTDFPGNAHAVAITYHYDEYMQRLDQFFKAHLGR